MTFFYNIKKDFSKVRFFLTSEFVTWLFDWRLPM